MEKISQRENIDKNLLRKIFSLFESSIFHVVNFTEVNRKIMFKYLKNLLAQLKKLHSLNFKFINKNDMIVILINMTK